MNATAIVATLTSFILVLGLALLIRYNRGQTGWTIALGYYLVTWIASMLVLAKPVHVASPLESSWHLTGLVTLFSAISAYQLAADRWILLSKSGEKVAGA